MLFFTADRHTICTYATTKGEEKMRRILKAMAVVMAVFMFFAAIPIVAKAEVITPYDGQDGFINGATFVLKNRRTDAGEWKAWLTAELERAYNVYNINTITVYGLDSFTGNRYVGLLDHLFSELRRLGMGIVVRIEGYDGATFAFNTTNDVSDVISRHADLIDYVCANGQDLLRYFAINMPVDDPSVQANLGGLSSQTFYDAQAPYAAAIVQGMRDYCTSKGFSGAPMFLSVFFGWDNTYNIPSYEASGADGYFINNYSYPYLTTGQVPDETFLPEAIIDATKLAVAVDKFIALYQSAPPVVFESGFHTVDFNGGTVPDQTAGLVQNRATKALAVKATVNFYRSYANLNAAGYMYFGYNLVNVEGADNANIDWTLVYPQVTAGEATRTAADTATVKFTSDEAGEYYYSIVDSDQSAPSAADIVTGALGGTGIAGENTINLASLTSGAKDVYVLMKNWTGATSEVIKIEVPDYDGIAPVLTQNTVNRTSNADATIEFTSNEAGTYYWQLNGALPTASELVAAAANQTSLTASKQTVTLSTLSPGTNALYVAAKDAAGNISDLLTVTIAAYVPPFYAVENIKSVPNTTVAGTPLNLTAIIEPANATNQTIVWSVAHVGTTGASITGNTLNTTSAGTAQITATITDGAAPGTPYTKTFTITVTEPAVPPVIYPVLEAAPQWSGSGTAVIRINAPDNEFVRLTLAGQVIATSNYNKTSGSTVITLLESYVKTLANGSYTFRAEFEHGYSDFSVVVAVGAPQPPPADTTQTPTDTPQTPADQTPAPLAGTAPQTGDNTSLPMLIVILVASLALMAGAVIFAIRTSKRAKNKE